VILILSLIECKIMNQGCSYN